MSKNKGRQEEMKIINIILYFIRKPVLVIMVVSLTFLFSSLNAQAVPDSKFGVTVSAKNGINATAEDVSEAVYLAAMIGSTGTFIHSWNDVGAVHRIPILIGAIRKFGMTTMLQIKMNRIGEPNPPDIVEGTSYADADVRERYLTDIGNFALTKPDYMILSTEANMLIYFYPDEWPYFVTLYQEAYDLVKSISPDTKIGVSLLFKLFVGERQFHIVDDLVSLDFLAFTTYPQWLIDREFYESIDDISVDWYGQIRMAYPDIPIIFSEVGWTSDNTNNNSTEEKQAYFVQSMPRLFSEVNPELVIWTILHDTNYFRVQGLNEEFIAFLVELGVDVEKLFMGFNGMGLRNMDGTMKPAWYKARELDFSAPPP